MYRDTPPEIEVERLKKELENVGRDLSRSRTRFRVLITVILGAIPPALVLRYHVPSRILLLDVVALSIWALFIIKASRRD